MYVKFITVLVTVLSACEVVLFVLYLPRYSMVQVCLVTPPKVILCSAQVNDVSPHILKLFFFFSVCVCLLFKYKRNPLVHSLQFRTS